MERGPERLRPRRPRQAARRRSAPQAAHEDHGRQDDQPRRLRLPRRPALRHAPPAAEAAAVPRRHAGARPARQGPRPRRSQRARQEGHDRHRLVRPLARRQARRRVAVARAAAESGDVHVYDVDSGKEVYEVVPRVNGGTAGGDLAWAPDGKGFFYTRYPRGKERPAEDIDFYQQVYFHELGTPTEKDRYELGKDLPRIAEIKLEVDDATGRRAGHGAERRRRRVRLLPARSGRQMAAVQHASRTSWCRPPSAGTTTCSSSRSRTRRAASCCACPVKDLDPAKAKVIVPEGKDTIVADFPGYSSRQTVLPTATRLYVTYQLGGPTRGALLRLRRQAARRAEAAADLHRRRPDAG